MIRKQINNVAAWLIICAIMIRKSIRKLRSTIRDGAPECVRPEPAKISVEQILEIIEKNSDLGETKLLMIHSAFKGLGRFEERPPEVLKKLKIWVGETGLLIFPAFTMVGTQQRALSGKNNIDLDTLKITTGVLPGFSAKDPEFQRSIHPTHSVTVFGHYKTELHNHGLDGTATGKSSIFWELIKRNGLIVNLGTTLNETTLVHSFEEVCQKDFVISSLGPEVSVKTTLGGQSVEQKLKPLKGRLSTIRDVNRLREALLSEGAMREVTFGDGVIQLISAKGLYEVTKKSNRDHGLTIYGKYLPLSNF